MIKKYVEESLKYLLRTRLFIHKYHYCPVKVDK